MKKIYFLLMIIICIIIICISYYLGYERGYKVGYDVKTLEKGEDILCETDQDCANRGIICNKPGEQPICLTHTGRGMLDEPICGCMNPNMEW